MASDIYKELAPRGPLEATTYSEGIREDFLELGVEGQAGVHYLEHFRWKDHRCQRTGVNSDAENCATRAWLPGGGEAGHKAELGPW